MIAAKKRLVSTSAALAKGSREVDRLANRGLERAHPPLRRAGRGCSTAARRSRAWLGPRLRPLAAQFLRAVAAAEHMVRRAAGAGVRAATAASGRVTPQRAAAAVIVATGLCLVASQFIDYRGVEIGQPGYAGLPEVATPPTKGIRTAGEAHAYLLVPLGLVAVALGALAVLRDRRRLGLTVAGLGLVALAVILVVDLPAGLDAGAQSSRFAGATAVLDDGFYAELAAAGGLVLAGLLYYARPCRIRISSSGRAASARRRRPRRRASSRARVARSA